MSEYIPEMTSKDLVEACERAMRKGYWDKKLFPELFKRLDRLENLQHVPTIKEMKEALKVWVGADVQYTHGMFSYGEGAAFIEISNEDDGLYSIYIHLPLYLLKMLVQFYEGKELLHG